jgi:hypothetical protein
MDVLKRFRIMNCKPTKNPIGTGIELIKEDVESNVDSNLFKRLVGSLVYLTSTRPNIMYAVNLISRFMGSPKDSHWEVGKTIMRYRWRNKI